MNNKTRNIICASTLTVSLASTAFFTHQLYKTAKKIGQERPKIIQEYNNAKSTLGTLNYRLDRIRTTSLPYKSKEVIELEEKIFQPEIEYKKDLENTIAAVGKDIKTMEQSSEYKEYIKLCARTNIKSYTNFIGVVISATGGFISYLFLPFPLRKKYIKDASEVSP